MVQIFGRIIIKANEGNRGVSKILIEMVCNVQKISLGGECDVQLERCWRTF